MKHRRRPVWVLLMLVVSILPGAAADPVKLVGAFVWERSETTREGELEAALTASGDGQWTIAFRFDWEGEPHVFEGTATGSLTGDLTGNVASDDPGHPLKFEFNGTFVEGKFSGVHGYFNGKGELVDSGTLVLAPAKPAGSGTDDRILRKDVVVQAPVETVWNAWTTEDGLRFVSSSSRVELRLGGPYEWFLDLEPDENGRRGGEGARVLAFLPGEMLAFTWTFPPSIPSLRNAGATTQVVVTFDQRTDGSTHVRFAQHGWREGEDWDAGYAYFDRAWTAVLDRLKNALEASP